MDEPTRQPAILAGDQEREHSTELLSHAVVEGRLTLEEFSDRVERAQAARTREELAVLTQDLPAPAQAPAPAPSASTEVAPTQERHTAFCSRLVRSGPWELAARSSFRSIFGTITLDLSQARLAGPEVELEIFNLFGTVTVLVPEGVDVRVTGGGMFASQMIQPPSSRPVHGAPKLRIDARGPGGTLYVRSKSTQSP
ncbi:MAG: DUF1707 SHOCT-like domain-containing protein [Solirubrobacteraceae bacterium]